MDLSAGYRPEKAQRSVLLPAEGRIMIATSIKVEHHPSSGPLCQHLGMKGPQGKVQR